MFSTTHDLRHLSTNVLDTKNSLLISQARMCEVSLSNHICPSVMQSVTQLQVSVKRLDIFNVSNEHNFNQIFMYLIQVKVVFFCYFLCLAASPSLPAR